MVALIAAVPAPDLHRTIDAVWRMEAPKLIGALTRLTRDVGLAEELAQDALVAALEQWPSSGIPDNPGAWLTMTARNDACSSGGLPRLPEEIRMATRRRPETGRRAAVAARLPVSPVQIGS